MLKNTCGASYPASEKSGGVEPFLQTLTNEEKTTFTKIRNFRNNAVFSINPPKPEHAEDMVMFLKSKIDSLK